MSIIRSATETLPYVGADHIWSAYSGEHFVSIVPPLYRVSGVTTPENWVHTAGTEPTVDVSADNPPALTITSAVGAWGAVRFPVSLDLGRGGGLRLRLRKDANLSVLHLRLRTHDDTKLYDSLGLGVGENKLPLGHWTNTQLTLATNGQPATSAPGDEHYISSVEIQVNPAAGTSTCLEVQSIDVLRGDPRAGVVFCFDDGFQNVYTNAYPILRDAGMVGTIAVIPSVVGTEGYCTQAQLDELYAAGWSFVGHGISQMTLQNEANQRAAHEAARDYLAAHGYTRGARHWVYPGGAISPAVDAIAAEYWATRRPNTTLNPGANVRGWPESYDLVVQSVTNTNTVDSVTTRLANVVKFGGIRLLFFHEIVDTPASIYQWSTANLASVVEYCANNGIRSFGYGEAFDPNPSNRVVDL